MTAVAAITNGEIFHNFAKAYNKSLENKVSELDDKYFEGIKDKRVFTKEDWIDSDRAIQFFRHFLIEGIAGSGKSTAVAKYIINILK
jgi:signal recognition particle GTPase